MLPATSHVAAHDARHWRGKLELTLQRSHQAARLTRRRHHGPLLVQRPFYPEGADCCHVYLLHPPGGLVGGDSLACHIALGDDAHGLITTPSAGKAYRVADSDYSQGQLNQLRLAPGATLEWLPQETIAFNGAQPQLHTRIDFARSATVFGWDILCLGRPRAEEVFTQGSVRQHLELWCDDQPLLIERGVFEGGAPMMDAAWGLRSQPVTGTLYCYHPRQTRSASPEGQQLLETIRHLLADMEISTSAAAGIHLTPPLLSATLVNNIVLVRYLGSCTEQCRELFISIWQRLRPLLMARPAVSPRIWNT